MKKTIILFCCAMVIPLLQAQVAGTSAPELDFPVLSQTVSPFAAGEGCTRRTTQPFGLADTINTDGTDKYHTGVDVACKSGARIVAPYTCRVIHAASSSSNQGWGTNVICKAILPGGQGVCFRVSHMQAGSLRVSEGQIVLGGQTIGLEGNTGFATGVHGHFQVMDCPSEYAFEIDDGYAGSTGGFDQLRRYYNPLRFFAELKNPLEVRAGLNRARFEANAAFSGDSWISATPNFMDSSRWQNKVINGWEQRYERRAYAGNSNVYYMANYLVINQNGYLIRVRPYMPRNGAWRMQYKVPNDSQLNGTVRIDLYFKGYNDPVDMALRKHVQYVSFNSQTRGKYVPIGGYINCLKGKSCYVDVVTEGLNGNKWAGFDEIKFEYVSDMYEPFFFCSALKTGNDNFRVNLPANTEIGFISLIYPNGSSPYNLDLAAWHVKNDGRRVSLPCFQSSAPGADESCMFLQGEKGEYVDIQVRNPYAPYCLSGSCSSILVAANNYKTADFDIGYMPLQRKSYFADVGTKASWYSPWLYKAGAARLLTGVCTEDFDSELCLFKPERAVKKAELVKMLVSAIGLRNPASCTADLYLDVVKTDWYCPYVRELMKKLPPDFMWSGESPDRFFPDQEITRELAGYIAFKALGVAKDYDPVRDEMIFCDVGGSSNKDAIFTLHRLGIIQGFRPEIATSRCLYNFGPDQILNRAQAAKIAFKVFEYYYQKGL